MLLARFRSAPQFCVGVGKPLRIREYINIKKIFIYKEKTIQKKNKERKEEIKPFERGEIEIKKKK